jgi:hypothetical protein
MRRTQIHGALALISVVASGCTALHLERYPLAECHAQSDCEGLNSARHIEADACRRFQCVPDPDQMMQHTCRLRPRDSDGDGDPDVACGGTDCDDHLDTRSAHVTDPMTGMLVVRQETCDGIDNDCNAVVDDASGLFAGPASRVNAALPSTTDLVAADSSSGKTVMLVPQPGMANRLLQPSSTAAIPLSFRTQSAPSQPFNSSPATTPDNDSQCFQAVVTSTAPFGMNVSSTACQPGEAAAAEVDPATGRWMLAAVDSSGCAGGRLRAGVFTLMTTGPVDQFGPPRRSPIADGIGVSRWPVVGADGMVDPSAGPSMPMRGLCTGDATGRTPSGVTRPAVTALGSVTVPSMGAGPSLPQALVAWLGRPGGGACGAGPAPVEAIGTWLENEVPAEWTAIDATGSGVIETLGNGRGDAPPAIIAITHPPGYLVAFPASDAGVSLRFVGAIDTSVVEPLSRTPESINAYDTAPNLIRRTPALQVRDLGTVLADRGALESVTIAPRRDGSAGDLGVVVQSGCGSSARSYFARLHLDAGATTAQIAGTPLELGSAPASMPRVAYTASGLLQVGDSWNGVTVAANDAGGWWLSWVDGTRTPAEVVVRRVAELDGRFVDAEASRVPTDTMSATPPTGSAVFTSAPSDDHALSFALTDSRGAWTANAACRAR